MRATLLMLLSCLATEVTLAADRVPVPRLEGRVNDLAGVFSQSDRESLTNLLADYDTETHHQIAVLTIPTLNGEQIESFSLRVANTWHLGLKGWDDGILVTLAMREHGIRIELGKGVEHYISNAMAEEVINRDVVPLFRRGDFAGGVRVGLMTLMKEARNYRIVLPRSSRTMTMLAPAPPDGSSASR